MLGADLGEVYSKKYQKVQKKDRAPKAASEIRVALICIAIWEHFYRNLSCSASSVAEEVTFISLVIIAFAIEAWQPGVFSNPHEIRCPSCGRRMTMFLKRSRRELCLAISIDAWQW
jgi:hypothetical protein